MHVINVCTITKKNKCIQLRAAGSLEKESSEDESDEMPILDSPLKKEPQVPAISPLF